MLPRIPLVSTLFGLTYLALAAGEVPGLRLDRAAIALVGAAAMLAFGVLDLRDAAKAVDYKTIVLLFGMMVLVVYLRMAGFFALATERVAARCSGPLSLLAVVIGLSGVLSAFLVNDVVCVALTPLVLGLCQGSAGRRFPTSSGSRRRRTSARSRPSRAILRIS
jgi:Na+/H+ antiporter NhaD/arsenite permease-like protein